MTEPKPKRNNRTESQQAEHDALLEQLTQSMPEKYRAKVLWQRPIKRVLLVEIEGWYYLYPESDWNGEREFEVDADVLETLEQPVDWAQFFQDAPRLIRESLFLTGVVRRTDLDNATLSFGLQRLVTTLAERLSQYKE